MKIIQHILYFYNLFCLSRQRATPSLVVTTIDKINQTYKYGPMPSQYESLGNSEYEPSEELTPEEQCLHNLFDLAEVDETGRPQPCSEFFVAFNNRTAPASLWTSFRPHQIDTTESMRSPQVIPEGADVAVTVTVRFDSREGGHERLHNIDFVRTDDGIKAFEKKWFMIDDERLPQYVKQLDETQLTAMASDAVTITKTVQEIETEKLKLGPLTEEAGPDGIRRFHVGDILSIITGRLVSPRGIEGVYDILGYMTNDTPYTTQLGRFGEECRPYLRQQFDEVLAAFYEPPEEATQSTLSTYKWLGEMGHTLGESLLAVKPISESDHAVLDPITELTLDHGSDFVKKKIISVDLDDPEAGETE